MINPNHVQQKLNEAGPAQPELSRTERRDQKKKQTAGKQKPVEKEDLDPDLINPNHVQQKMNISDLSTPRELTRRERYARIIDIPSILNPHLFS